MKAREIELGDVFIAVKIVKKLGLKTLKSAVGVESVNELTPEEKEGLTEPEVAALFDEKKKELLKKKSFEVVSYLLENLEEAEGEILLLLSGWTGTTPEEFKKIKISELRPLIADFVEINSTEELKSFFSQAVEELTKQR